jgi:predicted  nucleic acid-binding Zn-ribbon protein
MSKPDKETFNEYTFMCGLEDELTKLRQYLNNLESFLRKASYELDEIRAKTTNRRAQLSDVSMERELGVRETMEGTLYQK